MTKILEEFRYKKFYNRLTDSDIRKLSNNMRYTIDDDGSWHLGQIYEDMKP